MASCCCYFLGIQDAPRKRQAPSQSPGAWTGLNVVITMKGVHSCCGVTGKIGQDEGYGGKWKEHVDKKEDCNQKELESDVHLLICDTYTFVPREEK